MKIKIFRYTYEGKRKSSRKILKIERKSILTTNFRSYNYTEYSFLFDI